MNNRALIKSSFRETEIGTNAPAFTKHASQQSMGSSSSSSSKENKALWDSKGLTSLQDPSVLQTVKLAQVTVLSVQNNALTSLAGVGKFTKLNVLNATNNQISDLTAVAEVPTLGCLILNQNLLTSVQSVVSLRSLNTLVLSHNKQIQDLASIAEMSWLKKLSATDCGLTSFPWRGSGENKLWSLEELRLNNNELTKVDPAIGNCTSLQRLYLANNQISGIHNLSKIPQLLHLDLKGNPVCEKETFEEKVMTHCPKLRFLNNQPTKFNVKAVVKSSRRKERKRLFSTSTTPLESEGKSATTAVSPQAYKPEVEEGPLFEPSLSSGVVTSKNTEQGTVYTDERHSGIVAVKKHKKEGAVSGKKKKRDGSGGGVVVVGGGGETWNPTIFGSSTVDTW